VFYKTTLQKQEIKTNKISITIFRDQIVVFFSVEISAYIQHSTLVTLKCFQLRMFAFSLETL
jgi:hypothetical protein